MDNALTEKVALLRDEANYAADVITNDVALTGIREECVWNVLESYHVVINRIVDIMHDLLEGVGHYVLVFVLSNLIEVAKFFSIDTFNCRVATFSYGCYDRNKPRPLKEDFSKRKKLSLSASEMLTLIRVLGPLIEDYVPEGNPVWHLYLSFKSVVDFVVSSSIPLNGSDMLRTLVEELNDAYLKLTKENLEAKFHFLTHYPELVELIGSLLPVWAMRNEAKDQVFKTSADATTSRLNVFHFSHEKSAEILRKIAV